MGSNVDYDAFFFFHKVLHFYPSDPLVQESLVTLAGDKSRPGGLGCVRMRISAAAKRRAPPVFIVCHFVRRRRRECSGAFARSARIRPGCVRERKKSDLDARRTLPSGVRRGAFGRLPEGLEVFLQRSDELVWSRVPGKLSVYAAQGRPPLAFEGASASSRTGFAPGFAAYNNARDSPAGDGSSTFCVLRLGSLIKIRFSLCCHIWYGFPACTLG